MTPRCVWARRGLGMLNLPRYSSGQLGALGIHVHRIKRLAGSHEEPVSFGAAEAEVRASFRKMNLADECAVGRENMNAVVAISCPSRRGPHVAVHVAANAIGRTR